MSPIANMLQRQYARLSVHFPCEMLGKVIERWNFAASYQLCPGWIAGSPAYSPLPLPSKWNQLTDTFVFMGITIIRVKE